VTRAPNWTGSVLEIDQGNTRTKWRLLDRSGSPAARGASLAGRTLDLPLPATDRPPIPVRVVSVATVAAVDALRAELRVAGYDEPCFAVSEASRGRLRSGYLEPARLGADRWVALVAAATATEGAFAVLDAGSAITLDVVGPQGRHEGGWIVPGLRLMRQALLRDTAGIRYDVGDVCSARAPGRSTADAVEAGTAHMARDFASMRWRSFGERYPGAVLFVTGGDGALVASGLDGDVRLVPDLVLDGLRPLLG
jgi:type III pantothenate kinase